MTRRLERWFPSTPPAVRPDAGDGDAGGLLGFIPAVSPRYVAPRHLGPVIDMLERAASEPLRVVLTTPPRHAKTETVLHAIAYHLHRNPELVIGYVSYAVEFARSKSRRARWIAEAAGVEIAADAARLEEWRTPQGGGLLATGIGGPLTGHGVNILLVDDPVKNRLEAESATYRERTWEWFNDVAYPRIEPGGSAIVVQTRWHPDDLAGRLIAQGWDEVRLPAIAEEDDPLGRAPGEALWPERWPVDKLLAIKAQVGEYTWASLYQGRPRARGGAVFRDAWFYEDADAPGAGYRVALGADFAYTSRTYADYSVVVALAEHEGRYYVLDVARHQVEAPQFGATLREYQRRYRATITAHVHGTEQGIVDFLARDYGLDIDARPAVADKFVRAQPVAAAWNEGRVLVPREAPWLDAFLDEVTGFTGVNDVHDDQVDALASAFAALLDDEPLEVW